MMSGEGLPALGRLTSAAPPHPRFSLPLRWHIWLLFACNTPVHTNKARPALVPAVSFPEHGPSLPYDAFSPLPSTCSRAIAQAFQRGTSLATQPVNGPSALFFKGTAADRAAGRYSRATRQPPTRLGLRDPTPDRQAVEQPSPRARKGGHRSASRARTPPKIARARPT